MGTFLPTESTKKWFLTVALSHLNRPYIWGGDDPSGFDCSGFVIECLKTIGVVDEKFDATADQLLKMFIKREVGAPSECTLLFYLNADGKAYHIVICLDQYHLIGANGGDSDNATTDAAWRDNAYIKIRPIHFDPAKHKVISLF